MFGLLVCGGEHYLMRMRGFVAVAGFSAAVLMTAPPAFAAPAQTANVPQGFIGSANLNLGSLMMTGFALDTVSPSPAGARFEFGQVRNWDPSRNLFPLTGSLNSTSLSASNFWSSAEIAVAPGVSFGLSHLALGLPGGNDLPSGGFSQELAVRLDPSLRSTGTTAANLNLSLTDWSEFAITASHSNGNSSLLGMATDGLRAAASDSSALGISARVGFAEGWVTTLAYAEGVTQLDLNQMAAANAVRSDSYAIGLARTGLFGNDALGIALSRPLQIYTANSAALGANNLALSSAQARESDVELGYVTSFLDGTLALQANAAYQLNAAGARGQNALAAVARAKLNF
jgi:hypothetical protein